MTVTRITTYATHQQTLRDFMGVQSRLGELQKQISSGFKSDTYDGLNGQVELFSSMETKIAKAKSYQENNALIVSRMQATSKVMDDAISVADQMSNLIVLRRSTSADSTQLTQQMKSYLQQLAGALNTTIEGRYIFSGSSTTQKPVQDNPIPVSYVTGRPDSSYYNGSDTDLVARVDDNMDVKYNIRADHPGFQKIFAAANQAIAGDSAGGFSDEELAAAFDLMQQGIKEINSASAKVNANIVTVQQVNDRHETLQLYWKGLSENISKTDMVAASTQVAIDQSVLQATFQVFSSINQLRLSDFLR